MWLAPLLLVACADEPSGHTEVGDADLLGDAAPLTCMQVDELYFGTLASDTFEALRACTRDDECATWQPTLTCEAKGFSILACETAVRADQLPAALTRRDELAENVCARSPERCRVGVSCPPSDAARCVEQRCVMQYEGAGL